ncbi:sensor histidine kinase [Phytohabitans kaempferiae]|uniref:Oxygen sensor histidine kinase NreB n=1 Tax=Phytohabitans kaempferiae TaxID=1620943 RepID=A0ABV6MGZ5_9ACTN
MGGIPGALRKPRRTAAAAAGVAVVLLVLIGQLADDRAIPLRSVLLTVGVAAVFAPLGALVMAGVPRHAVGRLMFAAGAFATASVLAASWAGWLPLAWFTQWSGLPPLGLLVLALLYFPDGRLPSRRWRFLALLIAGATAVAAAGLAVGALDHPRDLVTTPDVPLTDRADVLDRVAKVAVLLIGAGLVAVVASLVVRWRGSAGETRQQLACLLPAAVLFPVGLVLAGFGLTGAWILATAAIPLAMAVAVLRYRLYDLDRVINRSVVWLVMTLLLIGGFVAIVRILRDLLMSGNTSNASLVATGMIAVTFEPVRRRVQRLVDHLLYGERDDPYRVIVKLGDLHGQTTDPDAMLPGLASAIARSLWVPYVAVRVSTPDGPRVVAEHGRTGTRLEEFDMVARGETLGQLVVATRGVGDRFTGRERRLLADVAQYFAAVTETTRLIRDLQDSRERLITAREEERRRLRRDLHDGVGPALTGITMQVSAARKAVGDPERVGRILDTMTSDLEVCRSEVRQLLRDLHRPAELDSGLEAALRAACERFEGPQLAVDLHVAKHLDGLPAAIEVAAYRIVSEALTNVAKHAKAASCTVTVDAGRALSIDVVDDGIGISRGRAGHDGVGLESMRERAAELGGECVVTQGDPRGTTISVQLPLPFGRHIR